MIKPFTTITVVIFMIVGFVHALRLLLGWEVTVDRTIVPMWASIAGLVVSVAMIAGLWWEHRR
ncbi:MAG: hypothetical protein ACE5K1_06810 [Acidiferrobacterales bacterium]